MSAYEELHKRCYDLTIEAGDEDVHIILREVLRTLEAVTPEMVDAWIESPIYAGLDGDKMAAPEEWLAMLRASPLVPPKDKQ